MTRSRRNYAVAVLAACIASFVACVASDFTDGQYACDPAGAAACPPGLVCARDGLCRVHDVADGQGPFVPPDANGETGVVSMDATTDAGDASDACATATWSLVTDAWTPLAVALADDGRLFAGGQAGNQGWLAEVDSCDGGIVRQKTFAVSGTTGPVVDAMLPTATKLLVCGGAAVPDAIYGTVDKALTTPVLTTFAGTNITGFSGIAVATDGAIWTAGTKNIFGTPSQGWVVHTSAPKCEATIGTSAVIAAAPAGSMYVLVDSVSAGSQVMLVDPACALGATVGPPLVLGTSINSTSLLVQKGVLYAGGTALTATANRFVFLAGLDLVSKKWTVTTVDPNPTEPDVLGASASDTNAFFLGVTQRAGFGTGTSTLYRFDPPFTTTSVPVTTALPFGATQIPVRSLAVAPAGIDGVYIVAGSIDGTGGIARCKKSGECAH